MNEELIIEETMAALESFDFESAGSPQVSAAVTKVKDWDEIAKFWIEIKNEAELIVQKEPLLSSFFFSRVLKHDNLASALADMLAVELVCNNKVMSSDDWSALCNNVLTEETESSCDSETYGPILLSTMADLKAIVSRDPAASTLVSCFLNFKGFKALQSHRIAHALWTRGRTDLACLIQSVCSEAYSVDIHPGAVIGAGLMLDHVRRKFAGLTHIFNILNPTML